MGMATLMHRPARRARRYAESDRPALLQKCQERGIDTRHSGSWPTVELAAKANALLHSEADPEPSASPVERKLREVLCDIIGKSGPEMDAAPTPLLLEWAKHSIKGPSGAFPSPELMGEAGPSIDDYGGPLWRGYVKHGWDVPTDAEMRADARAGKGVNATWEDTTTATRARREGADYGTLRGGPRQDTTMQGAVRDSIRKVSEQFGEDYEGDPIFANELSKLLAKDTGARNIMQYSGAGLPPNVQVGHVRDSTIFPVGDRQPLKYSEQRGERFTNDAILFEPANRQPTLTLTKFSEESQRPGTAAVSLSQGEFLPGTGWGANQDNRRINCCTPIQHRPEMHRFAEAARLHRERMALV